MVVSGNGFDVEVSVGGSQAGGGEVEECLLAATGHGRQRSASPGSGRSERGPMIGGYGPTWF
jgi:hypothetical protein